MAEKRLLLLSNSKNYGMGYLEHAGTAISGFLGREIDKVLFVPFAGVRISHHEFGRTVRTRFLEMGYGLESIHEFDDPQKAVHGAEAVVVGGGNTFCLLRRLYETGIIEAIRGRVENGCPYIGWSAGSNVACPTIRTTNDMPIVEPPSLDALGLVPFQINPHYTDAQLAGHQGETREERILEFIEANPGTYVAGLREGSALQIKGAGIRLLGDKTVRVFRGGTPTAEYGVTDSLEFLLEERGKE